jgi:hypothetical protein
VHRGPGASSLGQSTYRLPTRPIGGAKVVLVSSTGAAQTAPAWPGVPPQSGWECPVTHPIEGNFTTHSGERCIYHVPGGQFYGKTKPERCYLTEADAVNDGCRRSKR